MGGGRARATLAVAAVAATALLGPGCGESHKANEQRPGIGVRVSVTVTDNALIVQPKEVATGPEELQQIPQNRNDSQPSLRRGKGPLGVTFVVANQTGHETALTIRGGGEEVESEPIPARSPETFRAELLAGRYTVSARGVSPAGGPADLTVGSFRASSENEVLLP
jgi:hypothetical protein